MLAKLDAVGFYGTINPPLTVRSCHLLSFFKRELRVRFEACSYIGWIATIQTAREREREGGRGRESGREGERQTDRQTDRDRDRETETERFSSDCHCSDCVISDLVSKNTPIPVPPSLPDCLIKCRPPPPPPPTHTHTHKHTHLP